MVNDKFKIRSDNESLILNAVIEYSPISRADLSKNTGLNKASVSEIVKKLIDDNLVFETGEGESQSQGGRKPILLQFNERGSLVAAVDLSSDYISVSLSYLDGSFIFSEYIENIEINKDTAFKIIQSILDPQISKNKTPVVGLCVAIHGTTLNNKIVFTPQYDLYQSNLYEDMESHYDFPIYFQNEANLSALGEYVFGSKAEHLVSLSIHSGIGAGIISNGVIRAGSTGQAGEVGHTILFPNGRQCPCGSKGCIEEYASKRILYSNLKKKLNLDVMNADIVKELYDANNEDAMQLILENIDYISIVVNNLIMHYNPNVIVVNGSYYRKIPELIDLLIERLTSRIANDVKIRNTSLSNDAIILGCIAYTVQKKLNIKDLKFDL